MFTFLISTALSPFNCVRVSDTTFVLWKNPSEVCFRGKWSDNLGMTIILGIVYLVLVPLILLFIFIKYRKEIDHPTFFKRFGSLVIPFKLRFFYWELVMLVKRVAFMAVRELAFIVSGTRMKFILSTMIIAIFTALEVALAPYATEMSNLMNFS